MNVHCLWNLKTQIERDYYVQGFMLEQVHEEMEPKGVLSMHHSQCRGTHYLFAIGKKNQV